MNAAQDAIVVFITAPNREEAVRLAEMLVERRLAACVQILPGVESIYRWQGKIERGRKSCSLPRLQAKFENWKGKCARYTAMRLRKLLLFR